MRGRREQVSKAAADEGSDGEEPLVDLTKNLSLHSKRTERATRKQQKRDKKAAEAASFLSLPSELLLDISGHLRPSDCLRLRSTCSALKALFDVHGEAVAKHLVSQRYSSLARCFPRPVLLRNVDAKYHVALQSQRRQRMLEIHKRPYQHIKPQDPNYTCSCLTCILAWNNLCVVVDLAHWQNRLDHREPLDIIDRGTNPGWNVELVLKNGIIVEMALQNTLWYALILEKHLDTTVRTIQRYRRSGKAFLSQNQKTRDKNGRPVQRYIPVDKSAAPYDMTNEDAKSETDQWLDRQGPPCYEFPWRRDVYYALETYLPNRRYDSKKGTWLYYQVNQHDLDLEWTIAHALKNLN